MDEDKVNPSAILNHFTDESAHQEVASLFYAQLKDIESDAARDQAIKEAVIRVKSSSVEKRRQRANPNDLDELQRISDEKRMLEELMKKKVL
jgi:DNA primase